MPNSILIPLSAMSVNSPLLGYFHGDIVSFFKFEGFSWRKCNFMEKNIERK